MILTPEDAAERHANRNAAAEGAGRLLAGLLPALNTAMSHEGNNLPGHISQDLSNLVAELISTVRGFTIQFENEL